ncbi:phage tail tape measure protein [Spongiactinospora sp. TRM90649]|uniref:phage tail tape measure protein n=1 Tax=Spongiactinospora sp. TRM90649 TaxID=3031114 RepID=UPI0023F7E910|nr:phage tail tape measure protein [Spongiactinospora sp. TRM90649]MDF5758622.1 phage tail tape measure protein [Spongiactinospora sp. TRM90649]
MPDRTVTVRGRFDVSGIIAGARAGAVAFKGLAKEVKDASGEQRAAFDALGSGAAVAGGAMVAGFGLAVKAAMDFDKEMSKVQAVSGATGKELAALRQNAIEAGQATAFSATEAAKAQSELAKAGISTADILGGALKGSLDLAAAGGLDLAEAATVSAQAMNIFSLQGKDVGRIADTLAAGANKSAADVADLAWAMRMGGQVAAQTGLTLEDTVGVLSAFADNALIGSDAGTSLKTMLQRLANPTNDMSDLMRDLGIQTYDANGTFVGMASFAGQLQKALGGLTQEQRDHAMAVIFGADAVRGANVLYKIGKTGVEEYTRAVTDQGAAGRMAGTMMDNLAGDLEKLKGSLETALIQGGSGATGALRTLVQVATGAVDTFSALPGPVQGAITVVGGLAGAVTLLGGAMMVAVPKMQEYREALASAGPRTQAVGRGLSAVGSILTGPWGLAIGAGVVALGVFAAKHREAQERIAELKDTLDKQTGAISADTRAKVINRLETEGVLKAAQKLGLNMGDVVNSILGVPGALERVNSGMAAARDRADALDEKLGGGIQTAQGYSHAILKVRSAVEGQNSEINQATEAWKREQVATDQAAGAAKNALGPTSTLGRATGQMADEAGAAADQTDELRASLEATFNPSIAAFRATTRLKGGYRDLLESMAAAKGRMDGNTAASGRLRDAFAGQLETVADLYTSTYRQTQSTDKASKAVREQLPVLTALAGRNKEARTQVDKLAAATGNATGATKTNREAFIKAATAMSISRDKAKELWAELKKIKSKDVDIAVSARGSWSIKNPGTVREFHFASGGAIPATAALGPGGPTSDDVPIWASVGEHMWTAREVEAVGGHEAMLRMRRSALRGEMRGYATGGAIDFTNPAARAAAVVRPVEKGTADLVAKIANVYAEAWKKAAGSGGPVVAAARSQIGLPYSWGGGGRGGPSYGIGRGAGTYGFDCSGLTEFSWWQGRRVGIGGVTYTQHPASVPIGGPRPGALGFNASLGHVVLASNKPGYVIEAPYTGSHVREVRKSMPDWRWPRAAMAEGGPVLPREELLAERSVTSRASRAELAMARLLGMAGDPGRMRGYAGGGWVTGPAGQDAVPLMATAGEFVVNAQAAAANAALVEAINGGSSGSAASRSASGFGAMSMAFRPGAMSRAPLAEVTEPLKEVAKSLRDIVTLREGMEKLTGTMFGQTRALMAYESAWDAANAALKANGKTLNINKEKGRENRSALLSLAEAAHDVVAAMAEKGASITSVTKKMTEQRREFIKMAKQFGLTSKEAAAMADRLGLIPSKTKKLLTAERKDTAYNKKAEAFNKKIEAKASGGRAGGWTLVGEEGPELLNLPSNSYVLPAGTTRALLSGRRLPALPTGGGGGAAGGPIHITLRLGDRTLGEVVVDPLRRAVHARGGDVQAVLGNGRR